MEIHEKISEIKTRFKLNNSKLGEIAGVSSQTIADIENGVTANPKVSLFVNLCSKLEIDPSWLLIGEGPLPTPISSNTITGKNHSGNNNSGNQWHGKNFSYKGVSNNEGELRLAQMEIESLKREVERLEKYIKLLEKNAGI